MEVLKLYIHVNGCEKVESECATVQMISFDGRCDGDYFRGEILPGGVDTQIYYKDQPSKLSARYLVQGIYHDGSSWISDNLLKVTISCMPVRRLQQLRSPITISRNFMIVRHRPRFPRNRPVLYTAHRSANATMVEIGLE